MKLIGDNAGRSIIAFSSPSQGVDAKLNVNTQTAIILDNQGGSVQAGQATFNQGEGFFLGWLNGTPVFSIGTDIEGMTWDGDGLNVIGRITASSGIITGDFQIGTGGDLRSGMTGYLTGVGYWLDYNGGLPRFAIGDPAGDFIAFDGTNVSGRVQNGVLIALTSNLIDDANLGATANINLTTGLPATIAQANALGMILDAQTALPVTTSSRGIYLSDNGGAIYTGVIHDTNENYGFTSLGTQTIAGSTATLYGGEVRFTNPGQPVNILAMAWCYGVISAGTSRPRLRVDYSKDGGVNWVTGGLIQGQLNFTNGIFNMPLCAGITDSGVTPSDDILVRVMGFNQGGAESTIFTNGNVFVALLPVSNFSVQSPLAATLPSSRSMSCSAVYPTTSCLASIQATKSGVNGVGGFSDAWAKISGTGTLSGTTTPTCTVSDTETTADGGVTHTTTINDTVTDNGQSYSTTAGSASAGTATVTIGAHSVAVGNVVTISGCTPSNYNGTKTVTGISGTTIQYAVSGSPGAITVQGSVGSVKVTTGNCVITGTFTRTYGAVTNTLTGGSARCFGHTGASCVASTTMSNVPGGGDLTYTYANVKVSGGFTLSGSTTNPFTVQQSGTIPGSDATGSAKGTVTDGHSNSASATRTTSFQWLSND